MRTLLLLLAMGLLAIASGLSFVVRAAAQAPGSAELNVDCGEPIVVGAGTPALLTCTGVAGNPGADVLRGAQLEFLPVASGLEPPDLYVFRSETHDGVRSVPGQAQLTYDFGDIAPGASSTIMLEIIVRSTHGFGADVALVTQPNQQVHAYATVRGAVGTDSPDPLPITLTRVGGDADVLIPPTYHLTIENAEAAPFDSVTAEISPGTGVVVKSAEWKPTERADRETVDFGALAAGSEITRDLTMVTDTLACTTVHPILIVTIVKPDGARRQPVVAGETPLGDCGRPEGGGGLSLPPGGSGPSARGAGQLRATAAAAAAIGALCFAMGATMRQPRRNRRNDV